MKKWFKLSDFGVTFSTRAKADEVLVTLDNYIKSLNSNDVLILDLSEVEAISYSFFDQFLSKVSSLPLLMGKRVSTSGWSDSLLPVIDKSLHHRHCDYSWSDSERVLVCQAS
jgi:hypothetical protein